MTISYPLSLPSTPAAPSRVTLRAFTQVAYARSIYTGRAQIFENIAQLWVIEVTMPIMNRSQAEEWSSFLLKLNGPLGTFLMGDPAATSPRGSASGTPLVNGGLQTGKTLETKGWTPSNTNILRAGDYIQIGNRLYKNLNDVNSDSSGFATLDIWPRLRENYGDGASIITSNTKGLFRLSSNEYDICSIGTDKNYEISFTGIEDVAFPSIGG